MYQARVIYNPALDPHISTIGKVCETLSSMFTSEFVDPFTANANNVFPACRRRQPSLCRSLRPPRWPSSRGPLCPPPAAPAQPQPRTDPRPRQQQPRQQWQQQRWRRKQSPWLRRLRPQNPVIQQTLRKTLVMKLIVSRRQEQSLQTIQ